MSRNHLDNFYLSFVLPILEYVDALWDGAQDYELDKYIRTMRIITGATAAILVFRFSPKSIGFFHSRSSMAVSNMNLIRALVSQLRETQALACGGDCGGCSGGDGVRTKTIISPKFLISEI